MRYHFQGRQNLTIEDIKNITIQENFNDNEADKLMSYVRLQRRIAAERRIEKETNPQIKREMEELYFSGDYDFDFYFGEDSK